MEFSYQMNGHYEREKDEWRRTREIVAIVFNANSKHKKKSKDLMPIDDNERVDPETINSSKDNYWKWRKSLTPEEYRGYKQKIMDSIKRSKN